MDLMGWEEVADGEPFESGDQPPAAGSSQPAAEDTPFAVDAVDGIVYAEQTHDPELTWQQQQVEVPPPPTRTPPAPPRATFVEPWKPGPEVDPRKFQARRTGPNPVRVFLTGMIPILFLIGVVFLIKSMYGF